MSSLSIDRLPLIAPATLDEVNSSNNTSTPAGMASKALVQNTKPVADDLAGALNIPGNKAGATILILKDQTNITAATNNFYLTGMQIQYAEKAQVLETFGSSAISFFGQKAVIYNFTGVALDWISNGATPYKTMQLSSLLQLYNNELRGTQLLKNNSMAILKVFNHVVKGYPLSFNTGYSSASENMAQFSMSWAISSHSLAIPSLFTETDLKKLYSPIPRNVSEATRVYLIQLQSVLTALNAFAYLRSKTSDTVWNMYILSPASFLALYENTELELKTLFDTALTDLTTALDSFTSASTTATGAVNATRATLAELGTAKSINELTLFKFAAAGLRSLLINSLAHAVYF